MKWQDSILDENGNRTRYAYRQDRGKDRTLTLTDYNGRRMALRVSGTDIQLAEATPYHRKIKGKIPWLVRIDGAAWTDENGKFHSRKHVHLSVFTKDEAIETMLNYEQLRQHAKASHE
jgi:hypothetical protein